MNKEQYLQLLINKDYGNILYNCYLEEVKVEPKVDIHSFGQALQILCLTKNKNIDELVEIVLEHYNTKFAPIYTVYSKDNKFITII